MSSEEYFAQVAGRWDEMRAGFFSEAVREKAFTVAKVQPGRIAADLGAGTGFIAEGLLQRGLRAIAVDPSPAMLAEMRRKLNSERVAYLLGDAEALPLGEGSVDYAFANMCLHHVETPLKAIREMARILRPGGMLVITDLDEHAFEFLREEHHDRWLGFKREDVQRWLSEAGLQEARVECAGENCCAPSHSGEEYASISIFVASGRKP
jgi:ubiquinone/menaquinone biosynthesis C-methylase UbiE